MQSIISKPAAKSWGWKTSAACVDPPGTDWVPGLYDPPACPYGLARVMAIRNCTNCYSNFGIRRQLSRPG